jgi:hypothetical protein
MLNRDLGKIAPQHRKKLCDLVHCVLRYACVFYKDPAEYASFYGVAHGEAQVNCYQWRKLSDLALLMFKRKYKNG